MSRYLRAFGRPTFLLGVNYWSRAGGPRMWESGRWDERQVAAEITQMRSLGLNACRAFFFNPTFMLFPPRVEEAPLARMRTFFELCNAAQLAVMPSLLVGHMSGENYDFPGQRGRSPYTDEEVLAWQLALARAGAGALAKEPALAAWVLSNEMPLWGGPDKVVTIAAWAQNLASELRGAMGERVPVGVGDGYMNARGGQNGFDPEALDPIVDFHGPHAYYGDADALRQALYYEYSVRSLQHFGKPILFEEFGCSSQQAGGAEQAALWREVIAMCMSVGVGGALGWCMSDFALPEDPPYRHHAFELEFGATRADGSEKPVAHDLRAAGRLVSELDWEALEFARPRVALLRPSYTETTYPFSWENRDRMLHGLLQSFTMARKAGLEVEVLPESHPLDGFDLVLVPSTQKLLASTWERLAVRAQEGAIVYWSYFGGDYDFHYGMWCHLFERLTGCRHRLRPGVPLLPPPEVVLTGERLDLRVRTEFGGPFSRAYIPIEPTTAQVLARDGAGHPALVRNSLGQGAVYFLAYPWEYYLGQQADINGRDGSHALYEQLAVAARVRPVYPSSDPRVQTHRVGRKGEDLVWALNRSWEEVEARVDAEGGGGTYAPKEVRVLRVPRIG